jgi:hypothetical protein
VFRNAFFSVGCAREYQLLGDEAWPAAAAGGVEPGLSTFAACRGYRLSGTCAAVAVGGPPARVLTLTATNLSPDAAICTGLAVSCPRHCCRSG